MKACDAVEHPRWHRQTSPCPVRCRTAPKHGHVAALDDFVNMHLAAKPGMPWIKNFPYLGPMGVVLFRCTTPAGHIPALTGKHLIRPTSPRFRRSRQPEPGRRSTYPPKNLFRQAEPPLYACFRKSPARSRTNSPRHQISSVFNVLIQFPLDPPRFNQRGIFWLLSEQPLGNHDCLNVGLLSCLYQRTVHKGSKSYGN
jgi:hypothetical protein